MNGVCCYSVGILPCCSAKLSSSYLLQKQHWIFISGYCARGLIICDVHKKSQVVYAVKYNLTDVSVQITMDLGRLFAFILMMSR